MISVSKYQFKKQPQEAAREQEGATAAKNEDQHDGHKLRELQHVDLPLGNPFD
jgi:hypothetical protein